MFHLRHRPYYLTEGWSSFESLLPLEKGFVLRIAYCVRVPRNTQGASINIIPISNGCRIADVG